MRFWSWPTSDAQACGEPICARVCSWAVT
jgi:hypothetical protein